MDLSAALKPYVEVMYMNDHSVVQFAPSGLFPADASSINCDNPMLSNQQRNALCFDGNYVGQTPIFDDNGNLIEIEGSPTVFTDPVTGMHYNRGIVRIGRRNVEGGPRIDDRQHRDVRFVVGVGGDVGRAFSYDASFVASRVKFSDVYTHDLSRTRI